MYGNAVCSEENQKLKKTHFIISGKEIQSRRYTYDFG